MDHWNTVMFSQKGNVWPNVDGNIIPDRGSRHGGTLGARETSYLHITHSDSQLWVDFQGCQDKKIKHFFVSSSLKNITGGKRLYFVIHWEELTHLLTVTWLLTWVRMVYDPERVNTPTTLRSLSTPWDNHFSDPQVQNNLFKWPKVDYFLISLK